MTLSRRSLLKIAAGGAFMPWGAGVNVAFGADVNPVNNIFIYIFLRFGMDGLQLLAPADDGAYRDKRRSIGLTVGGVTGARPIGALDGVQFFLHPQTIQLAQMYDAGSLAFIHAAGTPTQLRSHFEVQEMVDKGVGDADHVATNGWLARHLALRTGPVNDFAATADALIGTSSLGGAAGIVPTTDLESLPFHVNTERSDLMALLNKGDTPSAKSVLQTLRTCEVVRERIASLPQTINPNYTYGLLSQKLQPLARALKLNLGIEVATVDFGGWDHHDNIQQSFNMQARELSNALFAFTDDLGPLMKKVTIVAMTEFGRRVKENANAGTDHGAASVMMALGAGVNGGRIYGQWPGLKTADLDGGDLRVTTDYRQVLGEILVKRQNQGKIESVFPQVAYKPLDIFSTG